MDTASAQHHRKRTRIQASCSVCHQRKVKCSRTLPCLQCEKYGTADVCRYNGLQPLAKDSAPILHQRVDAIAKDVLDTKYTIRSTPRKKSGYATHDWIWHAQHGPKRGRTHSPGILPHFDPLMVYVGQARLSGSAGDDDAEPKSKRGLANLEDHMVASLYDDMPLISSMELVSRYFDTWHTVFPVVDRPSFEQSYIAMLVGPQNTAISSMIEMLLVLALANATYPQDQAHVTPDKVARWLDLASGLPTSRSESGEVDIKSVRLMSLLNLAEQVLTTDTTASYIRSGNSVRSAMTLSLHRSEHHDDNADFDDRSLWNAIVELDQHACLAAGMPPSVPEQTHLEETVAPPEADLQHEPDQDSPRKLLERTLPIRHTILAVLNNTKHLMFEQAVELSTALTKLFAPVSTYQGLPLALRTFQYEYVFFVYRRFMSTLHRIFFSMDGEPAFYIFRGMAIRHARGHLREVCAVWRGEHTTSRWAALIASNGVMFRNETRHAIMVIALELYREDDEVQSKLLSVEGGRAALFETFKSFFGFLEQKVRDKAVPERLFLIPAMVYAHMQISARHGTGSSEYCRAMTEAGAEAEKCLGRR